MEKIKIEIKWAIIFVVMMLLWMVLERLSGLHDQHIAYHPIVTNFVAIPAIIIFALALLNKRNAFYNGKMTWGQGFITGVVMTAFITIVSPLTQYLTTAVISPDYFTNVIEYTVEQGKMTREEAEAYFNTNNYLVQTVMFTPVMGIVTTAIVAIFTRKK